MQVWILNEKSPELSLEAPRAFASADSAYRAACETVNLYRDHSEIADEIDDILRALHETFTDSSDDFCTGDLNGLFSICVYRTEVED